MSEVWLGFRLTVVVLAGTYWSGYKRGRDSVRSSLQKTLRGKE